MLVQTRELVSHLPLESNNTTSRRENADKSKYYIEQEGVVVLDGTTATTEHDSFFSFF
jgi:hypothetical protein